MYILYIDTFYIYYIYSFIFIYLIDLLCDHVMHNLQRSSRISGLAYCLIEVQILHPCRSIDTARNLYKFNNSFLLLVVNIRWFFYVYIVL